MNDPFDDTSGPVFEVTEAQREATPALIALWGFSDSGKTYSALRLARGLVGPDGKIVLIDTENRRAKFYAGLFGGWSHIDMQPPFTPARYQMAFTAAVDAGADVIIVDSQSHVWEGEGGVLDMAENAKSGRGKALQGLAKWRLPKMAYKRMTNALFRAPVNMIFCLRAKTKFVQDGSGENGSIIEAGQVPIADNRFIYEMTVAVHLESGTRTPISPVKAPNEIAHCIKPGEFITEQSGEIIAQWLAGGEAVDPERERWQRLAREQAGEGSVAFRDWWTNTVTKDARKYLDPIIGDLKQISGEADDEIARTDSDIVLANADDPLDDDYTPNQQAAE